MRQNGSVRANHPPSAKPEKPLPPHAFYVQRAILFSISGRWPLSKAERNAILFKEQAIAGRYTGKGTNRLRRDWGTLDRPQPPASTLPDSHAATARRFMEKRGWTLVKRVDGTWWPMRTI